MRIHEMGSEKNTAEEEARRIVVSVRREWPSRMFYLPGDVAGRLDSEYDRLVYECGQELGWTPKKSRHYYPVVAREGLNAVSDMGPEEFQSRVEELSLVRLEREGGGD